MPAESNTCSERQSLDTVYHEALRAYTSAVDLLEVSSAPDAFDHAYQVAERARALFEAARYAYRRHLIKHGCQPPPIGIAEHAG